MFSDLWNKIKEIVKKMLPKKDIESVLHVTPVMSDRMADAIQLWSDLYEGHAPWIREPNGQDPTRIVSLGLPALIASEKARMVTLEMKSEISAPMESVEVKQSTPENVAIQMSTAFATKTENVPAGPTERAEFLNKQYKKVLRQIRKQLEYGIAKGGLVIKPYVVIYEKDVVDTTNKDIEKTSKSTVSQQKNTKVAKTSIEAENSSNRDSSMMHKELDRAEIEFDFVQADRFFPLSFDSNGKVVEAAFVETKTDKAKNRVFIRLEYHKLDNRTVTVQNFAFESTNLNLANTNNIKSASNLGNPISLKSVPEWSNMEPITTIEGVDRLLLAYFKMPEANTIDPYSPLGVSGYSRVIQLIKDADMQYSRLLWEFEGGELAIDVDRDALKFVEEDLHSVLPAGQNRLFRKVDLNNEETYNVFAPALRDDSLVNGLNVIFMRIEDATGLSRGTLSDINAREAKTATELKILKQRSFSTNADIQYALQEALEDVIYVMDVYCTLYEVTPPGDYEASFEWDDSIIVDSESELQKRITLMQNGLASKLETRMWYFGETENQARQALQQVDEEATQAMLQNAQAEALNNDNEEEEPTDKKDTKSPADTTHKKISKGKQADSLENPNKSKTADQIKGKK